MGRRKQSPFEDLMDLAAMLPWRWGVGLAVTAYFILHHFATLPMVSLPAGDPKAAIQAVGSIVNRQMTISLCTAFQYIVPLAFLLGALVSAARRHRHKELIEQVAARPSKDSLENISWREFEALTAEAFRRRGYTVEETGGDGPDGGVDLVLRLGKDKYLVQCKQWKTIKVGVATVRELYGVMAAEGAVGGFVVTSGEFTEDAQKFAEGRSIHLMPSAALLRLVQGQTARPTGPTQQTTPVCPKCGCAMVQRTAKRGELAGQPFWGCTRFPDCRGIRAIA